MFKPVVPGLYRLALGMVNAYLLYTPRGAWLIDTGDLTSGPVITRALQRINLTPAQLRGIIITHLHYDHSGGLAYLQQHGAPAAIMHPRDADDVRHGMLLRRPFRLTPPLNVVQGLLDARPLVQPMGQPAVVDATAVHDTFIDDVIQVIETPGHSAGHITLLWQLHGGVLIGGDVCMHVFGLRHAVGHEDEHQAAISRRRIGEYQYDTLVVGHGTPLYGNASDRVRHTFGA
jgi:glyoxylase-like metal-dependent hydrolase (beta-lactamase superfamily II)